MHNLSAKTIQVHSGPRGTVVWMDLAQVVGLVRARPRKRRPPQVTWAIPGRRKLEVQDQKSCQTQVKHQMPIQSLLRPIFVNCGRITMVDIICNMAACSNWLSFHQLYLKKIQHRSKRYQLFCEDGIIIFLVAHLSERLLPGFESQHRQILSANCKFK